MSSNAPASAPRTADGKSLIILAVVIALIAGGLFFAIRKTDTPVRGVVVVDVYDNPKADRAYVQGFEYRGADELWVSTGRKGESWVYRIDTADWKIPDGAERKMPNEIFGEGLTIIGDKGYQVVWRQGKVFVHDLSKAEGSDAKGGLETVFRNSNLPPKAAKTLTYTGEGWGLTHFEDETVGGATRILMSNGSDEITIRDPATFEPVEDGVVKITADDKPVTKLNELEYVRGVLYANIFQQNRIAAIAWNVPGTPRGEVLHFIELDSLLDEFSKEERKTIDGDPEAVLNGIAWHEGLGGNQLLVTGKLWPKIFLVKMVDP